MGDCHILCAATSVPIEPGSRAIGILMSQTDPKYETVGAFPHKPCHYWQFVAGPFLVEDVGDYTPLTNFQDGIRTHVEKLTHLEKLTETPLNKIVGNKLVIPLRGRPPEYRPLSMIWFREEAWEFLKTPRGEEGYWGTFRRELIEFALGKRTETPEHFREKESFLQKMERRKGQTPLEICRGEIADAFIHDESVNASLIIHLDFGENPIEKFLEGFLEFLAVADNCRDAGIILQPNTYANQEHWYNFKTRSELHQLARDIETRWNTEQTED